MSPTVGAWLTLLGALTTYDMYDLSVAPVPVGDGASSGWWCR
ncbi:MAG: hypothetical protein ACLPZR_08300 [Solirubrobacteraceae bacterium]